MPVVPALRAAAWILLAALVVSWLVETGLDAMAESEASLRRAAGLCRDQAGTGGAGRLVACRPLEARALVGTLESLEAGR